MQAGVFVHRLSALSTEKGGLGMGWLVAALLLMIVALFWWGQVEKQRLLAWSAHLQAEWTIERSELLDRIKPDTAPFRANQQTVPEIRQFDLDDDEQYQQFMSVSKDELAELVEAGEL